MNRTIILSFCALCAFAAYADNWIFTLDDGSSTAGYLTDGTWKFKATVSGTELTVGRLQTDVVPAEVTPLDFSKPVTDGDSTTYTIVSLDDILGYAFDGRVVEVEATYRNLIGTLTLPTSGLRKIGHRAFYSAANLSGTFVFNSTLTTIGNQAFRNDTNITVTAAGSFAGLTSIGEYAFENVNVTGALYLPSIQSVGGCAFKKCQLTSVKFGPGLTALGGGWDSGCFQANTLLEKVEFDPASAFNIGTFNRGGYEFSNCTKLKDIDLSSAKALYQRSDNNIAGFPNFGGCTALTKVTFGKKLELLDPYPFKDVPAIAEVHFTGPPPATLNTPVFSGASSGKLLTTYVHLDKNDPDYDYDEALAAWGALTQDGELLEEGSTWSEAKIGSGYLSRPLILYVEEEKGELGHWVYDDRVDPAIVSNGVWKFEATLSARSVTLGKCIAGPTELSELDFTKSLTDYEGQKRSFSAFNTAFATGWIGHQSKFEGLSEYAQYVGRIAFPKTGVTAIGSLAFAGCVNCTEISNCIPDSVTSLGFGAFCKVPLSAGHGCVRFNGVSSVPQNVFNGSTWLEEISFGSTLKSLAGAWMNSAFLNCTHLTNVVFDAGMSGGYFNCSVWGPFYGCTALKKLDLSGFGSLQMGDQASICSGTGIGELILGENMNNCPTYAFKECTALTNITFKGLPPTTLGIPFLKNMSATQKVTTWVHKDNLAVSNSADKCWLDYAADCKVDHRHTTWAADYVTAEIDLSMRPLLTIEPTDGLLMLIR